MKIRILGSCSGTEPMPNRHQTSWTIESNGKLYIFDAGENNSFTGYLNGLDYLSWRALFISHCHIDHTGGLANLLWLPAKLMARRGIKTYPLPEISLFFPDADMFPAMKKLFEVMEPGCLEHLPFKDYLVQDGCIYKDENITVHAIHNEHLGPADNGNWHSFSYKVCCEGKSIVFSGDIKKLAELDCFLKNDETDLFFMETGHHHPWEIAQQLREGNYPVAKLVFLHHGRDILNNLPDSYNRTMNAYQAPFSIAEDNDTIVL